MNTKPSPDHTDCQNLKSENEILKLRLRGVEDNYERQKEKMRQEKDVQIRSLEESKEKLHEKIGTQTDKIRQLDDNNETKANALKQMKRQEADLTYEIMKLEGKLRKSENVNEDLREQVKNLQNELDILKEKIKKMQLEGEPNNKVEDILQTIQDQQKMHMEEMRNSFKEMQNQIAAMANDKKKSTPRTVNIKDNQNVQLALNTQTAHGRTTFVPPLSPQFKNENRQQNIGSRFGFGKQKMRKT